MSKTFFFGAVIGLALSAAIIGAGASRLNQIGADEEKRKAELARYQAEAKDATPIERGVLTPRQRIHANLLNHYRQGKPVTDSIELARASGGIAEVQVFGLFPVLVDAESPEKYFGELTNESDAVIRGRVLGKASQLTEDELFIFTDYDVSVAEVVKDNAAAPIGIGELITVTRPGGKVLLDGVVLKASDNCFDPLPSQNEVVLFLKSVAQSGAYRTARCTGSFELNDSALKPLTGESFPPGVLRDAESLVRTIRAVTKK